MANKQALRELQTPAGRAPAGGAHRAASRSRGWRSSAAAQRLPVPAARRPARSSRWRRMLPVPHTQPLVPRRGQPARRPARRGRPGGVPRPARTRRDEPAREQARLVGFEPVARAQLRAAGRPPGRPAQRGRPAARATPTTRSAAPGFAGARLRDAPARVWQEINLAAWRATSSSCASSADRRKGPHELRDKIKDWGQQGCRPITTDSTATSRNDSRPKRRGNGGVAHGRADRRSPTLPVPHGAERGDAGADVDARMHAVEPTAPTPSIISEARAVRDAPISARRVCRASAPARCRAARPAADRQPAGAEQQRILVGVLALGLSACWCSAPVWRCASASRGCRAGRPPPARR